MVELHDEVTEIVGLLEAVPPIESVGVDDKDDDGVTLGLEVLLSLPVEERVSVVELDEEPVGVLVDVGVLEFVLDFVKGAEFVLLDVIEGVVKEEGEILDVASTESVVVAENEGVDVALAVVVIEFD